MGTYGRNVELRIPPRAEQRRGRYAVPTTGSVIPLGAPIITTGDEVTDLDLTPVELATGPLAPKLGACGLLLYEWGPAAWAGVDPALTTYSDRDFAPLGAAIQMLSGPEIKVVFTNTVADDFLDVRPYPGRTMVAGMGATPTVDIDDLLTPGPGNDSGGYWEVTTDLALAWLRVTNVDAARLEVEAQFVF